MLELNTETISEILLGLNMLNEISKTHANLDLSLRALSPQIFFQFNTENIESWGNALIGEIFSKTITESREEIIDDGMEVINILKDIDIDTYSYFEKMAVSHIERYKFDYQLEDDEIDFDEKLEEYFSELNLAKLTIKSSLFDKRLFSRAKFDKVVPYFLVEEYELKDQFFVGSEFDETKNSYNLWYLITGDSDFLSYGLNNSREFIYQALIDSFNWKK